MIPELILREERQENFSLLVLLGGLSVLLGYMIASVSFPSQVDLLTVFFGSIPTLYPLVDRFLEDELERRPHLEEVQVYGSIFAGSAMAFFLLGFLSPGSFQIQLAQFSTQLSGMGVETAAASGNAVNSVSFEGVLSNNLFVFGLILGVSSLITSAGVFILTWNASVLGVFLGVLVRQMPDLQAFLTGHGQIPPPWAYLPHAVFEMTGFIVAGVSGSLVSAAMYRRHFDRKLWENYVLLVLAGLGMIGIAASLETGKPLFLVVSGLFAAGAAYGTAYTGRELGNY